MAEETPPADAGGPERVSPPTLSLPRGGGAVRGIGETFTTNPATGTGAMTVPLATSPGRSGFGPKLALSYDSGAGNGPFGLGWSLALPAITRRTDRGLPRYHDAAESDVFLLSGAEDLVPVLARDGSRHEDTTTAAGYTVHRYRPRTEGLFARIERWTDRATGEVHWRSISGDNITTRYGTTASSRIADPHDPARVFSWLICESYDDRGNVITYHYRAEDSVGVDPARAHERHRSDPTRSANRYLTRIRYGNRSPWYPPPAGAPAAGLPSEWLFEVVFDYGEHDLDAPPSAGTGGWTCRNDPFSSYRAGFEVRTYRLCRRVLMFHHFPQEEGVGPDCLVRSTDLEYGTDPGAGYSFLRSVVQTGYARRPDGSYRARSLPPVEFEYRQATLSVRVAEVDAGSLENLPYGLAGAAYRWVDLDGEGIAGILAEQAGGWYYKRNLSPVAGSGASFGPLEQVAGRPSGAALAGGRQQLRDLAGDGQLDLVDLGSVAGFYRRTDDRGWSPFVPFTSLPGLDWTDPNLTFVDLTGDGHADLLLSDDDAWCWHPSLAESGFGPAERVSKPLDEEQGPRLVLADGTQTIHLADASGDGLVDLVRIRNGEVCYWPNLGYGRFGARVTMDGGPWFDSPDQFDPRRLRLADIDGSGIFDLLYLAVDGVHLYLNQSGNSWAPRRLLPVFPAVDDLASVEVVDLFGNGTACLVWSSPLPGDARRSMRYVDLLDGQKPHLLTRTANNLGAETQVHYTPSTRFYLADRLAGRPWLTRLPFPVQVVERVETLDRVSGNRFVSRYAYHHGYFDGHEREFRGFGLVEQWDTEEISALDDPSGEPATNEDAASHVPPVHTKTWYHTGSYLDRRHISDYFAGLVDDRDTGEYYREPGRDDAQARALLLEDTVLPAGLTLEEERQACRALRGAMLRQEVYALDGSDRQPHPYLVTEQNLTVAMLQPMAGNRHAVFFTHPREQIGYQYERDPADPRVSHRLTLAVDEFGNVLRSAAAGYGRREPDPALAEADRAAQGRVYLTCAEQAFTNPVDTAGAYRTPLPSEARRYELTGLPLSAERFTFEEVHGALATAAPLDYEQVPDPRLVQKRLIGHVRTYYRPDDLGGSALPLGGLEARALPGEQYQLVLTPGLVAEVYRGRVDDAVLETEGYVHAGGDSGWWQPSGQVFLSPDANHDAAAEGEFARAHFWLPHRFRDAFGNESVVGYDGYDLAVQEVRDPLGNAVAADLDYRVLQPRQLTDPNGNRTEVAFDALGLVVGTAVRGKPGEAAGDTLAGFVADLDEAAVLAHLSDPLADPHALLQGATTRLVYDLAAYQRTLADAHPAPAVVATLARETHDAELGEGGTTRIQPGFSYSDGFGREIQRKVRAERDRWVGSGWTMYDNKGRPVRQFEPFFSDSHQFDGDLRIGVSPTICYDPVGRVVATVHPDHSWDKVTVGGWRRQSWDRNDTVLIADPAGDPDVGDRIRRLPAGDYRPTWHAVRAGGVLGSREQGAAAKAAEHAGTPSVAYLDSLGRTFLTMAHNRVEGADEFIPTRVGFDIDGHQRDVVDAYDRVVMHYDYDLLGGVIHTASMDSGERWTLTDVAGNPVRAWDDRGHAFGTEYDALRRPVAQYVRGTDAEASDPRVLEREVLVQRTEYGEGQPDDRVLNLRTRVYRVYDAAGVVISESYDFKGNLLSSSRQLAADHRGLPDWSGEVVLAEEHFHSSTRYDALNRPVALTTPDGSVVLPGYNDANLLERVDATLRGGAATTFVGNLDYNARGQREEIAYGNGIRTAYTYDPETLRLTRLASSRSADGDLQDLSYTYDTVGNIVGIYDGARQTLFYAGNVVTPDAEYTYDPLYRLVTATGREHIGQTSQVDHADPPRQPLPHPNDTAAMRRYTESYGYDPAGNIVTLVHQANGGSWTRRYRYAADSNRLLATSVPGDAPDDSYLYDRHGSMTAMPHLAAIGWDFGDRMQAVDLGGGGTVFYGYAAGGQRVRKVHEHNGATVEERIYLGGFEIYRKRVGDRVELERETLHLMDGQTRVALVETSTVEDGAAVAAPAPRIRYQLGSHLGSATLEVDDAGQLLSYEEYHPYGTTSYHAADSATEVSAKRYRYTGKETEEETGLHHHGARYYAGWLCRWTAADPAALADGVNVYSYASNDPVAHADRSGLITEEEVLENTVKSTTHRLTWLPGIDEDRNGIVDYSDSVSVRDLAFAQVMFNEGHWDATATARHILGLDRDKGQWAIASEDYWTAPIGASDPSSGNRRQYQRARHQTTLDVVRSNVVGATTWGGVFAATGDVDRANRWGQLGSTAGELAMATGGVALGALRARAERAGTSRGPARVGEPGWDEICIDVVDRIDSEGSEHRRFLVRDEAELARLSNVLMAPDDWEVRDKDAPTGEWYRTPDQLTEIEFERRGHETTNEGPHIKFQTRPDVGATWTPIYKAFIRYWEVYQRDWRAEAQEGPAKLHKQR